MPGHASARRAGYPDEETGRHPTTFGGQVPGRQLFAVMGLCVCRGASLCQMFKVVVSAIR
jgi:hypothetical protein